MKRRFSQEFWIGTAVFVAALLLCAPFGIYVSWIGDEGILLHGAQKILIGERLYRDFFEFHPPAGFLLTAVWLKLFGGSVLSFRVFSIVTIALIALLVYAAGVLASQRPWLSAFLALGWVELSQGSLTQVNHHYVTSAFSLAALVAVLKGGRAAALLAGLASGGAGMVTQTRGVLAAVASPVILAWRP